MNLARLSKSGLRSRVKAKPGFVVPVRCSGSLLLLLFACHLSFGATPFYKDIEVLHSDDRSLSFRLDISDPTQYVVSGPADSIYTLVLPVLAGIPPGCDAFISKLNSSGPKPINDLDGTRLRSYSRNLAEIVETRMVRGRKIATINIYPFYQDVYYSSIEVTITFQSTGRTIDLEESILRDKVFDEIFCHSILNYNQFVRWPVAKRSPAVGKPAERLFDRAAEWYKISTSAEGFVKVTGAGLLSAGIPLSNLQSDSIRLFYGGGKPLPVLNSDPRPSLEEVAIRIYDGGDAVFNISDHFIFFAEGADRWHYPIDFSPIYLEHSYTNTNCYWLAVSGDFAQAAERIGESDGSPDESPDSIITQCRFYSRVGENKILYRTNDDHIYEYYTWYWSDRCRDTFYVNLPNAVASESSLVRIRAKANGVSLSVNGQPAVQSYSASPEFHFSTGHLSSGLKGFSLTLDSNYNAPPYFDFCEVSYMGNLTPVGDILDFAINGFSGKAEIVIENQFSETPLVFDLSDPEDPVMITNVSISAADIVFQSDFSQSVNKRFYLFTPGKMFQSTEIKRVTPRDLRDGVSQTNMFIITPEQFRPYLEDYRQHREERSGINVSIISMEEIIDQFSFGMYDPVAIRDFLKYAYENYPSPPPAMVLLVGDGTYDFEDNLKTGTENLIPPYIHALDSTSSDDNFVYFGNYGLLDSDSTYCDTCEDRGYDMMIGRWPVKSLSQLNTVIDKVISYESSNNYGPWRTTVALVSDDEYAAGSYEGLTHAKQTEQLQKYNLPPSFRRNKIYLWEYPFDSNRNKPDVNDEIVRSFNEGTLVVNYVGHGNPNTWAHEHVFNRATDIQKLNNADRLPLVFTASCSMGFFDDPSREGMAEEFVRLSGGGAIGVVAATRLVYSSENASFNRLVFDFLFGSNDLSIGQSVFAAKLLRQYNTGYPQQRINDRKYAFFCDPFLKLGIPQYTISFTDYPDTLVALALQQVSGEMVDEPGGSHVNLNGTAEIVVYDSEIQKTYKGVNDGGQVVDSITYALTGPAIYRGTAEIANGYFDFSFIAPLDIGYGGNGAKIFAYAVSPESDGLGMVDSIPVSSVIASTSDSTGPVIDYTFANRQGFVSGDRISHDETLVLTLSDSSGINLAASAGHAITLIIDNNVENVINLTDLFQYNAGSFTTGEIRYDIGDLLAGVHRFKVKAWDNANNSSIGEFDAEVVEAGQFMLSDLLNYPNPMEETTTFSFSLTTQAKKIRLEIFTLSGKRIIHYEENSIAADFHEFYSWNGHDMDGDRVATGVYIYKVTAFSMHSDEVVESFGKVVVIN